MKPSALQSIKFAKLKRRLNLAQWQVVGLLEMLWLFTQNNAPAGNIGRFSNEDIAASLEWAGDADELIGDLIATGWVDESAEHRLVIHDWEHHCPTWTKANIVKYGRNFANSAKEAPKEPPRDTPKEAPKEAPKEPRKPPDQAPTYPSLALSKVKLRKAALEKLNLEPESAIPIKPAPANRIAQNVFNVFTKDPRVLTSRDSVLAWHRCQLSANKPVMAGTAADAVVALATAEYATKTPGIKSSVGYFSKVVANPDKWEAVSAYIPEAAAYVRAKLAENGHAD